MLLARADLLVIVAVVDIAIHGEEQPVPAKDIAARHNLPVRYLNPMLQSLAARGILKGKQAQGEAINLLARPALSVSMISCVRYARGSLPPGRLVQASESSDSIDLDPFRKNASDRLPG
jgi:DNA-binding IscR family transcriptional regulator